MFYFTCFNVEDPDDPSVGLLNGELAIPGNLLRQEVFEPVVNQVCSSFWSLCSGSDRLRPLDPMALFDRPGHRVDRRTVKEGRSEA